MLLIPSLKRKTKHISIETISDPTDFYLSLAAYRGEMKPLFVAGQKVLKYECLAESKEIFATKIHAPVSGTIKGIVEIEGKMHIHLENDFQYHSVEKIDIDCKNLTLKRFSKLLEDFGIEGAGGSRFPTALKYRVETETVETLIFNGVECEPYLSADAVLMKEKTEELIKTARLIQNLLKAKRVVFVLEKQNKDIAKILNNTANESNVSIDICFVPDTYPQGGELQVIKSVTGIELKKGEIPLSKGILVNNVGTLWAIHQAIFQGKPYTERIVTVSGNKSDKQGNYWVKIGTSVAHLLNQTQEKSSLKNDLTILGGAMMGKKIDENNSFINKGSAGVLLLKNQKSTAQNCIKCGECVDVCPQRLMPFEFVRNNENATILKQFNLQSCIECGACEYTCPSHIPLMESIFNGKKMFAS